jgi:hypothetical protein
MLVASPLYLYFSNGVTPNELPMSLWGLRIVALYNNAWQTWALVNRSECQPLSPGRLEKINCVNGNPVQCAAKSNHIAHQPIGTGGSREGVREPAANSVYKIPTIRSGKEGCQLQERLSESISFIVTQFRGLHVTQSCLWNPF